MNIEQLIKYYKTTYKNQPCGRLMVLFMFFFHQSSAAVIKYAIQPTTGRKLELAKLRNPCILQLLDYLQLGAPIEIMLPGIFKITLSLIATARRQKPKQISQYVTTMSNRYARPPNTSLYIRNLSTSTRYLFHSFSYTL